MDSFRTEINLPEFSSKISYQEGIFCIGSCFASHMAQKLADHQFNSLLNPFGILYNPFSISVALKRLSENNYYEAEDLFFHEGLWHSFDHHGIFSHPEQKITLKKINHSMEEARLFVKKEKWCIITLGTSYVFQKKDDQRIVANCHKLPGNQFNRTRMSLDDIVRALTTAIKVLKNLNPGIKFILTVSPVRHIRDGLIENQRSKATLIMASEKLEREFADLYYFPSYELMIDDLRGYRFYEADMIHPNQQAIDYIWQKFVTAFVEENDWPLMAEVNKLILSSRHRPLHPGRQVHQKFVEAQLNKINLLEAQHEFLDFSKEKQQLLKSLE